MALIRVASLLRSHNNYTVTSPLLHFVGGIHQIQGTIVVSLHHGQQQQQQQQQRSFSLVLLRATTASTPHHVLVTSASRIHNRWMIPTTSTHHPMIRMTTMSTASSARAARLHRRIQNYKDDKEWKRWTQAYANHPVSQVIQFFTQTTVGSMVVFTGGLAVFLGWPMAVGVTGLVAIHEGGHAWVMTQRGIPFYPIIFLPFYGAAIGIQRLPRDAWEDAWIACGGPVAGSLGAVGMAVVGHATQSDICIMLADFGFVANLVNLLPLFKLTDGIRIVDAGSPYFGYAGFGIFGLLTLQGYISDPIVPLIVVAASWRSFQRNVDHLQRLSSCLPPNFYELTPGQRVTLAGAYFGLLTALTAAVVIHYDGEIHDKFIEDSAMHRSLVRVFEEQGFPSRSPRSMLEERDARISKW